MKQIKKGFSLAEVLIAMGIISVIATIGFTIGRRGVESAYNQYIYTGYKGLSMAVANAVQEGNAYDSSNPDNFFNSINATLNINEGRTSNGTTFVFNEESGAVTFKMQVPAKKTRNGSTTTICLDYLPNKPYGGVLIPVQEGIECSSSIPNIVTRKDLLPFFIDNGITGRVIPSRTSVDSNDASYGYIKRQYYSIEEALCYAYTESLTGSKGDTITDCPEPLSDRGSKRGAIKVADPRKVN